MSHLSALDPGKQGLKLNAQTVEGFFGTTFSA